ncbi:hypothetical protein DCAR_0310656 [Daucus carota subsp. sativus]|uniref:Zinc transporter n=1 Tax=Daucus carota subsp. sativus TaxID=79200 RepID=A0AAF0WKT8_DAUCS|nr:hypothetical protein DCAR_0310656 [Daucus carota subsp. sativus]
MSSSHLLFKTLLLLCLLFVSATAHGGGGDDEDHEHDSEPVDLRNKSLILVKIWCLILVFVGTFVGGISPYFMKWNEGFLVLGTQFAGGVFLSTAIMHFLSDANETFEDLSDKEYPFAFMLACAGYLLTMLADSVISYVYGKQKTTSVSANDVELQGLFFSFGSFVSYTKADAWKALWTISLHKIFAAIAMGIALLRMIPDRPLLSCVAYAFAFAISSPIGVAIGIVIDATTQGAVADWIFAISMGLACGVFIHVSINHLLTKGYAPLKSVKVDTPHYRFLAVTLGVAVIAVVMIWDT